MFGAARFGSLVLGLALSSSAPSIELSIQHSSSTIADKWQNYAEVTITQEEIASAASSHHVLGPINDAPSKSSRCSDIWEKMDGTETEIKFLVTDKNRNKTVSYSYCDLRPVKNWKQFCRLLSNVEFVVEIDGTSRVKSAMVKPPTPKQDQMSLKRLGFVTLLSAESAAQIDEPDAPIVLPQVEAGTDPTAPKKPEQRGNWWWGFLMAMIAMQVLNALTAKEEPAAPAAAARPAAAAKAVASGRNKPRAIG